MQAMKFIFAYWTTLVELGRGPKIIVKYLDIPLQTAVKRSWLAVSWTTILQGITLAAVTPRWYLHATQWIHAPVWISTVLFILVGSPILYGLFRLYTRIQHIMATNIFKTRGQRLRLLNVETTVLPFAVPLCLVYALARKHPHVEYALLLACTVLTIVYLSYGYNLIFHKTKWRGCLLLVESTLVTLFVLAIGALAVTVTVAVLALFGLVILRPFLHHGHA